MKCIEHRNAKMAHHTQEREREREMESEIE